MTPKPLAKCPRRAHLRLVPPLEATDSQPPPAAPAAGRTTRPPPPPCDARALLDWQDDEREAA